MAQPKKKGKSNYNGNVESEREVLSESMGFKGSLPFNDDGIVNLPSGQIVSSMVVTSGEVLVTGKQSAAATREFEAAGNVPDWASHPCGPGAHLLHLYDVTIDTSGCKGQIYWG